MSAPQPSQAAAPALWSGGEPGPGEPFPRLLRTPAYAWWRSLVGALLVLVGLFVVAGGVLSVVFVAGVTAYTAATSGDVGHAVGVATDTQHLSPVSLLFVNLVLATGTLIVWATVRFVHGLRPRWSTSVRPGLRWRFFLACLPVAVLALLVNLGLSALVPATAAENGQPTHGHVNHLGATAIGFAVVIVLTTPLQALAEEYVFRGYLTQAVGSLFPRWGWLPAAAAVVVPALAFALAHGAQNPPLFFDRFAFGVLAGFLVVRVGGLEAGIALHVMNNFFAYGVALLFGDITTVLATTETSYWQIPVTVAQSLFFLLATLGVARLMRVSSTTSASSPATASSIGGRPV